MKCLKTNRGLQDNIWKRIKWKQQQQQQRSLEFCCLKFLKQCFYKNSTDEAKSVKTHSVLLTELV